MPDDSVPINQIAKLIWQLKPNAGELFKLFAEYEREHPIQPGRDSEQFDEGLLISGEDSSFQILSRIGMLLKPGEFAKRLGCTIDELEAMRSQNEALAVKVKGVETWLYPEFQLNENGVRSWIRDILIRLDDPMVVIDLLSCKRRDLDGACYLDKLKQDNDLYLKDLMKSLEAYFN